MDVYLLTLITGVIVVLIVICTALLQAKRNVRANVQDAPQARRRVNTIYRRNFRRRQANVDYGPEENDDRQIDRDNNENEDDNLAELSDHKIGAKKRAKLAAKAEKKIQREAAEREREEHKKREQFLQEERDKQAEREHVQRLLAEEAEKKVREEKEKQEYEEYLKIKEAFNIEEEGYETNRDSEKNLLQEFLAYIKFNKVLVLEDLAAHFGLKTVSVVERIQELQANGNLTGVIDDRGKFIYISQDELEAIAKFMRQRGRVSITELVENSNNLINLTPARNYNSISAR